MLEQRANNPLLADYSLELLRSAKLKSESRDSVFAESLGCESKVLRIHFGYFLTRLKPPEIPYFSSMQKNALGKKTGSRPEWNFRWRKSIAGPNPERRAANFREGENLYRWEPRLSEAELSSFTPLKINYQSKKSNSTNEKSPYRFNPPLGLAEIRAGGKELDPETGNYYYGARYYDPKISVWLSVDAMASKLHNLPLTPYHFSANNPIMIIDPDGNDWFLNDETGDLYWCASDPGEGYSMVSETADLTFAFTSYIDRASFDGMYGLADLVDFSGEKMYSTISLDFEEDKNGNPIGLPEVSFSSEIGETFGFIEGKEYEGLPNLEMSQQEGGCFSATIEKHSRVNTLEGVGMFLTGQSVVDVAQRLELNGDNKSISFGAFTNVYPSARVSVNGQRVVNYQAPSFYSTHGWWRKPSNSLYPRIRNYDW